MNERFRPQFFRRAMRRRWLTVVSVVLVGMLAGLATVLTSEAEYRATSVVFLDSLVGNPYSPTTPSTRQEQLAALTTEAGLVLTDGVVRAVEETALDAGVDLGSEIQQRTSTEVPSNSQVIHISFSAVTPEAAQFGAQALGSAYLEHRRARSEEVIQEQVARADEEIASVSALLESASNALQAAMPEDSAPAAVNAEVLTLQEQVRIYANQLGQLRIERSAAENASKSPGEIVSPARLPTDPEGIPAPFVAAGVVLVFLGAGVLLAFVREHLDTRLRTVDEIDSLGIGPVLGPATPWYTDLAGTEAEEPYRLAMNILQVDRTPGTAVAVLGTDGTAPVGVAAGLAHVLAGAGSSVALVSATPEVGPDARGPGLSEALADSGTAETADFVRMVRPGLGVMTAGRHPNDLPDLVQRPTLATMVAQLAEGSDTLFIVGPDARTATGYAVAKAADAVVLVATVAHTKEQALLDSVRLLEESGARLAGVMLAYQTQKRRQSGPPESTDVSSLLVSDEAHDVVRTQRNVARGALTPDTQKDPGAAQPSRRGHVRSLRAWVRVVGGDDS